VLIFDGSLSPLSAASCVLGEEFSRVLMYREGGS